MTAMRVTIMEDGPYLVEGWVPLARAEIVVDDNGDAVAWRETGRVDAGESYALCRCGRSGSKPFCDYTHVAIGFDGTETAGHGSFAETAADISGPKLGLMEAPKLCARARFCLRGGGLWHLVERCADPAVRALAIEEAQLCPAGRYVAYAEDGTALEPEFEPSIVLTEDPQKGVSGPVWVRGGVEIVDAEGAPYEIRNRVTLCRCGESKNKPFCDGAHIAAKFREDG